MLHNVWHLGGEHGLPWPLNPFLHTVVASHSNDSRIKVEPWL